MMSSQLSEIDARPAPIPGSFGALKQRLSSLVSKARDCGMGAAQVRDALLGSCPPKGSAEKKLKGVSNGFVSELDELMGELSEELEAVGAALSDLNSKI